MTFQMTTALGITVLTTVFLGWMGIRNQRSGWRRERSNIVLDTFVAWAEANAEMRATKPVATVPFLAASDTVPGLMGSQLAALHMALNEHAGVSPAATSSAALPAAEAAAIKSEAQPVHFSHT